MNDLLYTLETLTADARRASAGTTEKAAVIGARHKAILHLCDLITHGAILSVPEYERVRAIEREGEDMLEDARRNRQGLVDKLNIASRQQSFARCMEGTLGLPKSVGIPA